MRAAGDAGLTLAELGSVLRDHGAALSGGGGTRVTDVDQDSRSVGPGALFAARHGGKTDGLRYVGAALARGAVAVIPTSFRRSVCFLCAV